MAHSLRQFSFRELADIDGNRLEVAFNQALKRCADDCHDRPAVKKGRKVTMTCEMVPVLDQDGMCETVMVDFVFKDNVPDRQSKAYSLNLKPSGELLYHPEVLENHAQMALDYESNEET